MIIPIILLDLFRVIVINSTLPKNILQKYIFIIISIVKYIYLLNWIIAIIYFWFYGKLIFLLMMQNKLKHVQNWLNYKNLSIIINLNIN